MTRAKGAPAKRLLACLLLAALALSVTGCGNWDGRPAGGAVPVLQQGKRDAGAGAADHLHPALFRRREP